MSLLCGRTGLWMRQSFSHSSCSLRESLCSSDVDDIPVVAQMRASHGLVIDVPGVRVQRVPRAVVEETVELPRLHSLRILLSGAAHHRVDELKG